MTPPRFETIEQVVEEMERRWRALHRARDWRAVFAATYLRTTEAILAATRRRGLFEDPSWIVQIDCDFAARYFDAFDRFERGEPCPAPWQLAFEGAVAKRTLILQDVLLGMNAHINLDLPHSLDSTIPAGAGGGELEPYARDNLTLNRVLAEAIDRVQEEVADTYDPVLTTADVAFRGSDEAFTSHLIKMWRGRAWGNFLLLRNTPEPGLGARLIEEAATDNAVLLLQVQRAFPLLYWPNRAFRYWARWWAGVKSRLRSGADRRW